MVHLADHPQPLVYPAVGDRGPCSVNAHGGLMDDFGAEGTMRAGRRASGWLPISWGPWRKASPDEGMRRGVRADEWDSVVRC